MVSSELLKKHGFKEEVEEVPWTAEPGRGAAYRKTGYPRPEKRFRIVWEAHDLSLEEPYYWIHNYFEQDLGFPEIIKTEDAFAAAENSAFFGVTQQRIGAQQEKVSQYLATIGKMVKELFQLVRELRILDERINYYKDSEDQLKKESSKREKGSEITLKGIYIDLVQGGAKNPASIYGMARELEFTTLPDLFFDAPPMKHEDVDDYVSKLDFNKKVLEVLRRHLKQFIIWKERTSSEILTRRKFTLQYLRQHFDIIKMYMTWVKPYLRHVQRLTMKGEFQQKAEIVSAFESSMIDVEFIGVRPWENYNSIVMATFNFRTRPSLKFVQEGYQRGPIHVGKMMMTLRGYVWTKEEVENYIKLKNEEDFDLLKTISGSVEAAMVALGDELRQYLDEAGKVWEQKEESQEEHGHKGMFSKLLGSHNHSDHKDNHKKQEKKQDKYTLDKEKESVKRDMQRRLFYAYKNYKKGHGHVMW